MPRPRRPLVPRREAVRGRHRRERRPRVLICVEGEVTEKGYFEWVKRALRDAALSIEISDSHGDPRHLVDVAKAAREEAARDARRERDEYLKFDSVWCVSDVDEHPRLLEAVDAASRAGIHMAISNPAFELWVLLHFEDRTAFIDRGDAARRLRGYLPAYEKSVDCSQLIGLYMTARSRAQKLQAMHEANSSKLPDDNPASGVWVLVDALLEAALLSGTTGAL